MKALALMLALAAAPGELTDAEIIAAGDAIETWRTSALIERAKGDACWRAMTVLTSSVGASAVDVPPEPESPLRWIVLGAAVLARAC